MAPVFPNLAFTAHLSFRKLSSCFYLILHQETATGPGFITWTTLPPPPRRVAVVLGHHNFEDGHQQQNPGKFRGQISPTLVL